MASFEKLKVMLFYRDDVHDFCRDTGCHDPTKFEDLLFTLPFVDHRAYFSSQQEKHLNVCFKDAVMGTHRDGTSDKEVSNFILQGLGMVPASSAPAAADSASSTKAVAAVSSPASSSSSSSVFQQQQQQQWTCPTDPDRTVLILQRRNRRLLNAEELAKLATTQGLFGRVVEFDGMPVIEQIFTVS